MMDCPLIAPTTSDESYSEPASGFHTRKTLFTDDEGVYLACADRASGPRSGKYIENLMRVM